MKSQVTDWEQILAMHMSKDFYSEYIIYSYHLKNPIKQWAKNLMILHKRRYTNSQ